MKLRTSQVDEIQKEWGNKPCMHNMGCGHEIDDATGCDCDCFCKICGMRESYGFFEKRKTKNEQL